MSTLENFQFKIDPPEKYPDVSFITGKNVIASAVHASALSAEIEICNRGFRKKTTPTGGSFNQNRLDIRTALALQEVDEIDNPGELIRRAVLSEQRLITAYEQMHRDLIQITCSGTQTPRATALLQNSSPRLSEFRENLAILQSAQQLLSAPE